MSGYFDYYWDDKEETEEEKLYYYYYYMDLDDGLEWEISILECICLDEVCDNVIINQACDRLMDIFE